MMSRPLLLVLVCVAAQVHWSSSSSSSSGGGGDNGEGGITAGFDEDYGVCQGGDEDGGDFQCQQQQHQQQEEVQKGGESGVEESAAEVTLAAAGGCVEGCGSWLAAKDNRITIRWHILRPGGASTGSRGKVDIDGNMLWTGPVDANAPVHLEVSSAVINSALHHEVQITLSSPEVTETEVLKATVKLVAPPAGAAITFRNKTEDLSEWHHIMSTEISGCIPGSTPQELLPDLLRAPFIGISPEHTAQDGFYLRYVTPSVIEDGDRVVIVMNGNCVYEGPPQKYDRVYQHDTTFVEWCMRDYATVVRLNELVMTKPNNHRDELIHLRKRLVEIRPTVFQQCLGYRDEREAFFDVLRRAVAEGTPLAEHVDTSYEASFKNALDRAWVLYIANAVKAGSNRVFIVMVDGDYGQAIAVGSAVFPAAEHESGVMIPGAASIVVSRTNDEELLDKVDDVDLVGHHHTKRKNSSDSSGASDGSSNSGRNGTKNMEGEYGDEYSHATFNATARITVPSETSTSSSGSSSSFLGVDLECVVIHHGSGDWEFVEKKPHQSGVADDAELDETPNECISYRVLLPGEMPSPAQLAVVTAVRFDDLGLFEPSFLNHWCLCRRQGHAFYLTLVKTSLLQGRSVFHIKIVAIRHLLFLHPHVMWVDADTYFLLPNAFNENPLSYFDRGALRQPPRAGEGHPNATIANDEQIDVVLTGYKEYVNTGVMIFRNATRAHTLLRVLWDDSAHFFKFHPGDQTAMEHTLLKLAAEEGRAHYNDECLCTGQRKRGEDVPMCFGTQYGFGCFKLLSQINNIADWTSPEAQLPGIHITHCCSNWFDERGTGCHLAEANDRRCLHDDYPPALVVHTSSIFYRKRRPEVAATLNACWESGPNNKRSCCRGSGDGDFPEGPAWNIVPSSS